jgi:hypothetical protein
MVQEPLLVTHAVPAHKMADDCQTVSDIVTSRDKRMAKLSLGHQLFGRVPRSSPDLTSGAHNTRLLSFTFSASRYTLLPISLNFSLILAMPSSMVPFIDIPTAAGSFSVAA